MHHHQLWRYFINGREEEPSLDILADWRFVADSRPGPNHPRDKAYAGSFAQLIGPGDPLGRRTPDE
jgi:hypothetical protein